MSDTSTTTSEKRMQDEIQDLIFENNKNDGVNWREFPHFPMTYQEIFDMAAGEYYTLDPVDNVYRRVSQKQIEEARQYVRKHFTGRSDPTLKVSKRRK